MRKRKMLICGFPLIFKTFTLKIETLICYFVFTSSNGKKDDNRGNLTYITHINCICLCQNNLGDIRHDVDFGLVGLPCFFVEVLES